MDSEDGDNLPPPPPIIPPKVVPMKVPMARPGLARKGQPIQLLTNHFTVALRDVNGYFFHYSVSLKYEDGTPVDGKGIGRRVIDRLHQTYDTELGNKDFAYDGEKSLFTIGALPRVNDEFTVVLEDVSAHKFVGNGSPGGSGSPGQSERKRLRRSYRTKTFKVELTFAARVPMQAIASSLRGQDTENSQEALRVLDIILRQHSAKQGCLLVRQSFFEDNPSNYSDLGGGVLGCRGLHSSFQASQGGLSLNIESFSVDKGSSEFFVVAERRLHKALLYPGSGFAIIPSANSIRAGANYTLQKAYTIHVSTTMIVRPGPVLDFLKANQNVGGDDPYQIDWAKAKRMLKNLRVKISPWNQEYKITGLSELPCNEQRFTLRLRNGRNGDGDCDGQTTEITVAEYFATYRNVELKYSGLPCINVGKPKRPIYFPIELCSLVSLQRYTKALTIFQRSSLVEKSRQKPRERMGVLSDALKHNNYDADPMLRACGVSISTNFTHVSGRVLQAPKLRVGDDVEFFPKNGRWNFSNKKLFSPAKVGSWAVVNFSARCDIRNLVRDLCKFGNTKGIDFAQPSDVFQEDCSSTRSPPTVRVENMFKQIMLRIPEAPPQFLLCLLPERKNKDLYGPWKRKCLTTFGIITQCLAPTRVDEQYLTNVLLKINAKLGGINSLLQVEYSRGIPLVSRPPTMILGMDVSHGSPRQSDVPSIAAVVSSREWPLISKYRASVRTQSPKTEMIDSLFTPVSYEDDVKDEGIIRELLVDFYSSSGRRRPEQIIIFRDGVSESQFNQVLNIELHQIIEACKFLQGTWNPKFTVIVAQKNHHKRFFKPNSPDNVPPGTVVDNKICHPRNYDFYMCPHAGMIGTSRPTHYHVLLDEIGFSADDLQELVHSLSYVYQRSTTAISGVAPVRYAHLAATQMGQFIKFDDLSEISSSHGGVTSDGASPVPEMPSLHEKVSSSMFFC